MSSIDKSNIETSSFSATESARAISIKDRLEKGIYSVDSIPRMLSIENSIVKLNKHAPRPNELDSLEKFDIKNDLVETKKLIADSYGDWHAHVGMINMSHFESRERFDDMFVDDPSESLEKAREKISIVEALEYIDVKLASNMEYYREHRHELEFDLERTVSGIELNQHGQKLQQELFYMQMCNLFGKEGDLDDYMSSQKEPGDNEKTYMLTDFRVCLSMENINLATAYRGNYYLAFYFVSSQLIEFFIKKTV